MGKLRLHGTTFDYFEQGAGEPVVFVHGSASDCRTWQAQVEALGTRYRAIAYSRRYHWPNAPIPDGADYSMDEHVADLAALLRALGAAPAHLVGHSYGAFVCLLLAVREPALVRSLVLAEPPVITLFVSNKPRPAEILRLFLTRPRTAASLVKLGVKGFDPAAAAARRGDLAAAMRFMGTAVLGADAYRRLSASRLEQVRANAIAAEFLGSGFPPLREDALRALRLPTLLVNGQRSPRVFHRLNDRLQELLCTAERVEIPGASHIMHEDNPPAFDAAVSKHLER